MTLSFLLSGEKDNEKQQLLEQLQHLDQNYTGGLATYIKNAKQLLEDSRSGQLRVRTEIVVTGKESLRISNTPLVLCRRQECV